MRYMPSLQVCRLQLGFSETSLKLSVGSKGANDGDRAFSAEGEYRGDSIIIRLSLGNERRQRSRLDSTDRVAIVGLERSWAVCLTRGSFRVYDCL